MDNKNYTAEYSVLIILGLAIWMFAANAEKNAFNRCTGSNATMSDAIFTELRIENCKQ